MFKKFCCRFCILLGAIWRYNPQHKCSKTRGRGSKATFERCKKTDDLAREGVPKLKKLLEKLCRYAPIKGASSIRRTAASVATATTAVIRVIRVIRAIRIMSPR